MNKIGLAPLLGLKNTDAFLQGPWPKSPYVIHELTESLKPLLQIPFLNSVDSLLKYWPELLSVHLPDVKDESSAIETNSENARKLFSNGMALLFNKVHLHSEVLNTWLLALKKDLGLPASTNSRCMVYATPNGKGTAWHFDQNINFVVQLAGVKKWWLEPNTTVENPTERHTLGQPIDFELQSYLESPVPTKMTGLDRQEIILKPGSVLFVPRGYWHSTEAAGEALALNFTFNQPTWADLLTMALRSRLILSPDWRELADGVQSEKSDVRKKAQEIFQILLEDLVSDLPNWNAADILASAEGDLD